MYAQDYKLNGLKNYQICMLCFNTFINGTNNICTKKREIWKNMKQINVFILS